MDNRIFLFLAVVALVSIYDAVQDFPDKPSEGASDDGFHEFDEPEESAGFKYTEEAQEFSQPENAEEDEGIEIRAPGGGGAQKAFKTPINMPPVRFAFCVSCGYRQAFDQFSQMLREKYPGIEIVGENFPPPPFKAIGAQVISFAKIGLIVMVVMGRDPFQSLGMPTPAIFTWMVNNKLSASLMLFMLSNAVEGMLTSTGAFEIYLGNEQIWSKIESGRVPSPQELFQAIESQLAIGGESSAKKIAGGGGDAFGFDSD
jgi:selT/selW/selH-like putative selenoprotein